MKKKFSGGGKSPPPRKKIEPSPFDLAVINLVEYIHRHAQQLPEHLHFIKGQADVCRALGIQPNLWPSIRDHYRHVSTRSSVQQQITNSLKTVFGVDVRYIASYPHHPTMFLGADVLFQEPQETYGYSSSELRRLVSLKDERIAHLERQHAQQQDQLQHYKTLLDAQGKILEAVLRQGGHHRRGKAAQLNGQSCMFITLHLN